MDMELRAVSMAYILLGLSGGNNDLRRDTL